nr:helix-turn-helix transcriptional regulator [Williamsia sp.]
MPHPLDDAFASFLKSNRAKMTVAPGERTNLNRRVPGLRRQEFAELAGLSVEYYTKLEQGRALNPSVSVLNAIADASDLDRSTRSYLYRIAVIESASGRVDPVSIPTELHQLIRSLSDTLPAFVLTPWTDVVASNAVGARAFGIDGRVEVTNVTRRLFLEPDAVALYGDWDEVARDQVAWLRYDLAHHRDEPRLSQLIEQMLEASELFAKFWNEHEVKPRSHGRRVINHPEVGVLDMFYTGLPLPADPRLTVVTWSAPKGSPTAVKLAELARSAAEQTAV